jgi:hypothetical protein
MDLTFVYCITYQSTPCQRSSRSPDRIVIRLPYQLKLFEIQPQNEVQPQRRKLLFWRLGCLTRGRQGNLAEGGCQQL